MNIGVLRLTFRLHGNRTLKGKRRVANALKQKLRNAFNVAVAEVSALDNHELLVVALVTVANDAKKVNSRLQKCEGKAEAVCDAELVDSEMDVFHADAAGDPNTVNDFLGME